MARMNADASQAARLDSLYALRECRARAALRDAQAVLQQVQAAFDDQQRRLDELRGQLQSLRGMPSTLPGESVAQMKTRLHDRDLSVRWVQHDLFDANEALAVCGQELQSAKAEAERVRLDWQRIRDRRQRVDEAAAENARTGLARQEARAESLVDELMAARSLPIGVGL